MNVNLKLFISVLTMSFLIASLMILSNEYLRDIFFGVNIVLFPLSYFIVNLIGLNQISKFRNYTESTFKALVISILTAIFSSLLFEFYWRDTIYSISCFDPSTNLTLSNNIALALIIVFFVRPKKTNQ